MECIYNFILIISIQKIKFLNQKIFKVRKLLVKKLQIFDGKTKLKYTFLHVKLQF